MGKEVVEEKGKLELLEMLLNESKKNHLHNEIQLEYYKVISITSQDQKLLQQMSLLEKIIKNDEILLRIIRRRIKEAMKEKKG